MNKKKRINHQILDQLVLSNWGLPHIHHLPNAHSPGRRPRKIICGANESSSSNSVQYRFDEWCDLREIAPNGDLTNEPLWGSTIEN